MSFRQLNLSLVKLVNKQVRHCKDLHGQPQWRRKEIIVGFPLGRGVSRIADVGAFSPISGTG
jgi:hypothetical protein